MPSGAEDSCVLLVSGLAAVTARLVHACPDPGSSLLSGASRVELTAPTASGLVHPKAIQPARLETPVDYLSHGKSNPQHIGPIGCGPELQMPGHGAFQVGHRDRLTDQDRLDRFTGLEGR